MVENVLIKVDKFMFSMDFIALNIEEDLNMLVILGRSFLSMRRALIALKNVFRIYEKEMNDQEVGKLKRK